VKIDGVSIRANRMAGAVVGQLYGSINNCHVKKADIMVTPNAVGDSYDNGDKVGGIVGWIGDNDNNRTLTNCSATEVKLGAYRDVGGIAGCAGATIIDSCVVKNFTADVCGTSMAPAGGIVGCQGASSVAVDVTNCYVSGVKLTASAESHAEKTCLGGLIGKAAHVAVMAGDPNTECNVFNCFVSDVNLTNNTTSIRNGVVIGWVADTILFNDIYYVPAGELPSFGEDSYFNEWPFAAINAPSELTAEKLNKGNSTKVWVDDVVAGHPVINVDALLANEPAYVDYFIENAEETTAEETTAAPETQAPETQAPETQAPETQAPETTVEETQAPETQAPETKAPAQTEAPKAEGGCGGMIAGGVVVVALLGTALVFKKRN
jgi:hypothetical protein